MKRTVLIPLDKTDYSRKILLQVKKLIPADDTLLLLLHVAKTPRLEGITAPALSPQMVIPEEVGARIGTSPEQPRVYLDQLQASIQADIEKALHAEAVLLKEAGFQVAILVRFGDPADEILHVLNEKPIDLIAMTTHAREGLQRLFFGSVAEKVLHHVDIPILMMHPSV